MLGMLAAREGTWVRFFVTLAVLLVLVVVAVALGAVPAHLAARRTPRDELRVETGVRPARRDTGSDLRALVRIDRGSVWRSVPMRRGLMVLAIGPGLVALAGNLEWNAMTILPGLVASGAALLFGVNAWCLDGRGALWRESLPSGPRTVFAARVLVLGEWLLVASGVTLVLASLRAGLPAPHELSALLATLVVVTVQVVSASMRWSAKRPFSVDMRSARATPAPPVVMVGYSARLALSTTMTGLVFSGLARLPLLVAVDRHGDPVRRLVAGSSAVRPAGVGRPVPAGADRDDGRRLGSAPRAAPAQPLTTTVLMILSVKVCFLASQIGHR